MGKRPLLIRTDASAQIGTGHAMRCLALAQAWQEEGGSAHFVMAQSTPAIRERLQAEGADIRALAAPPGSEDDATETVGIAWQLGAGWIVVDGYHFGSDYQRAIRASGLCLLFVDDYGHASHYHAAVVLNQNISADETLYASREPYTHLLLGTRYALLRREFWSWRGWHRDIPDEANKVLVTMGGADPDNVTLRVLQALREVAVPGLEAQVAVGGSNTHLQSLLEASRFPGSPKVSLVVDTAEMPELMAWADVAVSAAGTTCWELALMRLPAVTLVLAENQRANGAGLAAAGALLNLGWHSEVSNSILARELARLLTSHDLRARMAQRAGALVDGRGGQRVAEVLKRPWVRVRPAEERDRGLLFDWANDPQTRGMSFHPDPIGWDEHVGWFARVIADPEVALLIAECWDKGRWVAVGQVRIDGDGTTSISVAPSWRGQGFAWPALQAAIGAHRARFPGKQLAAYIKSENRASQRVFEGVGFRLSEPAEVLGQDCLRYTYG